MRILLALVLLLAIGGSVMFIADKIFEAASARCPSDTFMSDRMQGKWPTLVLIALLTVYAFQLIALRSPSLRHDQDSWGKPWGRTATAIFAALALLCAVGAGAVNTSIFCLSPQGISEQPWPWSEVKRYAWAEVTRITVDCRHAQRGPDLAYVLTMSDGTSLDVAGAMPFWRPPAQLRSQLAGMLFDFTADIGPDCPESYIGWVGLKP